MSEPTTTTESDGEPMKTERADVLQVTLEPTAGAVAGGPLLVRMRVQNPSTTSARFCTYHTLFEGLRNNILEVTDAAGVAVPYRGVMAKRAPPGRKDFVEIPAGGVLVSEAVDVSEGYALPAGTGTLTFTGSDISGLSASPPVKIDVVTP